MSDLFNRPGLSALSYRLGDYNSFRQESIDRLISLRKLTTRDREDPALALLDACAMVADVLTFYQERIINEGYILTATERQSVLELARAIGYELDPGVAASTLLTFTVDDSPNAPTSAIVSSGTQIVSVPDRDQLPQTFETIAEFIAKVEWNAIKPRPDRPQKITPLTRKLYLAGIDSQLQPGDLILLRDADDRADNRDAQVYLLTLDRVQPIPAAGHTLITWNRLLPQDSIDPLSIKFPPRNPQILAFRQRANLFGHNAPRWIDLPTETKVANGSKVKGGVYQLETGTPVKWKSLNRGLTDINVRCLVSNFQGELFAGTANGIFRSQDSGENWTAINSGLTNLNVQTILITENDEMLAGTAADGVFRSLDRGDSWSPIGFGKVESKTKGQVTDSNGQTTESKLIPNTVVRALAIQNMDMVKPTITKFNTDPSKEKEIEISPGDYYLNLRIDDKIKVDGQTKTIKAIRTEIPSITILTLDSAFNFNPIPTSNKPFEVTRSDVTISPNNSYLLAGTDAGVYKTMDRGNTWVKVNSELTNIRSFAVIQNRIFARTNTNVYESFDGATWRKKPLGTDIAPRSLVALKSTDPSKNKIFVGAEKNVYTSENNGNWNKLTITNLTESEDKVGAIAINAQGHIFAFTNKGIFKSTDNGSNWSKHSDRFTNPDPATLTACLTGQNDTEKLFAAVLFTGFENPTSSNSSSTQSPFEQTDWLDFNFTAPADGKQFIDLDTIYQRVLADTWMILKNEDNFQLFKIGKLSSIQRKDFALDLKVTRIETTPQTGLVQSFEDLKIQIFDDLRKTIALIQSEVLDLAADPLNIPAKQTKIFFDPIVGDRVWLSQYVVGLQAQQRVIISGKRMRMQVPNVAGIARLKEKKWLEGEELEEKNLLEGEEWQRDKLNLGLTNTNVTCLIGKTTPRFVGTAGAGVFEYLDEDRGWKSTVLDLTDLNIQTLAATAQYVFAGTAGGGIFRRSKTSDRWEEKNINLIHLDVRTLLVKNGEILAGTIGGVWISQNNGDTWQQTNLDNTDVVALCELPNGHIVAGTLGDSVFISENGGMAWQPFNLGLSDRNIDRVTAFISVPNNSGISRLGSSVTLAGTAGSGILRLTEVIQSDGTTERRWEPIDLNPTDLNINCFAYDEDRQRLLVGTVSGGVFESIDNGNRWKAINNGLTVTDEQINPDRKVNINIRSIAVIDRQIFLAGVGTLISTNGLYTAPMRLGDRLQVLAPPEPLGTDDPEREIPIAQKWLVRDADGFKGVLYAPDSQDIQLEPATKEDEIISESAFILEPPRNRQQPVLQLTKPIQNIYDPATVVIQANVIPATHGETIVEVLGSGDSTIANQQFILKKPPLTYVSAPTPTGFASTLAVRVNGVLWQEVPSLSEGVTARLKPCQDKSFSPLTSEIAKTFMRSKYQ